MFTYILYAICFVAGIAVHRRHHTDAALNAFADAVNEVVAYPGRLLRRQFTEVKKSDT